VLLNYQLSFYVPTNNFMALIGNIAKCFFLQKTYGRSFVPELILFIFIVKFCNIANGFDSHLPNIFMVIFNVHSTVRCRNIENCDFLVLANKKIISRNKTVRAQSDEWL
jgi:hypothetical protein